MIDISEKANVKKPEKTGIKTHKVKKETGSKALSQKEICWFCHNVVFFFEKMMLTNLNLVTTLEAIILRDLNE